ncbi:hypothetical protein M8037_22210 [Sinorhizobium meliloti]|uniref:hypothetical protein n=1 Tax=Rhizobium meliloti TaxID=382 RepID=UPI0020731BC1|nr:hypothetical protein [Sinorhizobium meliloti]MCM5691442.1 hypothetical protein [Sinorhizobium meliloti]
MSNFKLRNFQIVAVSDPAVTWALFDIDFDNGSVARRASILDDGTAIRLSGIEASPTLREEIIGAAMEEASRRRR